MESAGGVESQDHTLEGLLSLLPSDPTQSPPSDLLLARIGRLEGTAAGVSLCKLLDARPTPFIEYSKRLLRVIGALNSGFVSKFTPSFLSSLRDHIHSANVEGRFEVMREVEQVCKVSLKHLKMKFIGARYLRLGIQLGCGKFGVVYKGVSVDGTLVAIKQINVPHLLRQTNGADKTKGQLEREIKTAGLMAHQNTLKLYDVHQTKNNVYMLTEFMPDGDLDKYLKAKQPLSELETRYWLRQLAAGLREMRSKGIVHRDLKPANLLLCDSLLTLKIGDFGSSKLLEADELSKTVVCTPLYMAPEILGKRSGYTDKVDLWSVGAIVYEMLAGQTLYAALGVNSALEFPKAARRGVPLDGMSISADMKDLLSRIFRYEAQERISWDDFFTHPVIGLSKLQGEGHIAIIERQQKRIRDLESQSPEQARRVIAQTVKLYQDSEQQHREEMEELKSKLQATQLLLDTHSDKEALFQQEKEKIHGDLAAAEQRLIELKKENVQLVETTQVIKASLCREQEKSLQQLENAKRQNEEKEASLKEFEDVVAHLTSANEENHAAVKELKDQNRILEDTIADAKQQVVKLEQELQSVEDAALVQSDEHREQIERLSAQLVVDPDSPIRATVPKISLSFGKLQSCNRQNDRYTVQITKLDIFDSNNIRVHFDATGDNSSGDVPYDASYMRLIAHNAVGRYEEIDATVYDARMTFETPDRKQGSVSILVDSLLDNRRYDFIYTDDYTPVPLFSTS